MIYFKVLVWGLVEKVIVGMFFIGIMYEEVIKELIYWFGNLEFILKLLINKFLELFVFKDDNILSLRIFVDNLYNIVRILKSYDYGVDLKVVVNM